MLNVRIENSGDTVILHCRGGLLAGKEASSLYNTVVSEQGKRVVILDLTEVTRIDARGLGALLGVKQWTLGEHVTLRVAPSNAVQEILNLTRLSSEFELCSPKNFVLDLCEMIPGVRFATDAEEAIRP